MKGSVILFIVEGPSDHSALIPYIQERLQKLKLKVTVKEMHGDILTEYIKNTKEYKINSSNVKGELKKSISSYFNLASVKAEKIKLSDIIKVYYVTDIDYCFSEKQSHHKNKSECLSKIFNFNTINLIKKNEIPFETIFFSKNLEHVTYGEEKEFSNLEKEKMAIEFSERALADDTFFTKVFKSDNNLKIWESYRESYEGIKNFRGRASNMNNFLDEYEIE
ncbi:MULTISPECIES: hypothetical protein [Fusobacterium]|jgi:hypothetical protein fuD12_04096|uniref:DUF4276 family protein n=1 Tax=Fusobacterium nucleatum TaxID=851 RepID=A0A323UCQ8_FUSNU|nr:MULTISPECIES: hypothetical protein [Fusobacterium]PCR86166.1 hypothetical protein CQA79_00165 [Fusobacterium nucleatum]PZA05498.1 hypothetical protein DNF10_01250 [Fusobacterium nucleatum]QJX50254.1 hypothetical protein HOO60_04995 [Fusobacterium nucleatum]HCE33100.1 hypothetical protein [Fusobacterium sp.]